jgi:hypothetical protein
MAWAKSQSILFWGAVAGAFVEIGEIINGSCAVWQQELMILAIIAILGLSVKNKMVSYLALAVLLGFYGIEGYEQFVESEMCSASATELTPLLVSAILSAISVFDNKK